MQQHNPPRRDLHTLAAAFLYALHVSDEPSEQDLFDLDHMKRELRQQLVDVEFLPPLPPAEPEPDPNPLAEQMAAGLLRFAAALTRLATRPAEPVEAVGNESDQFVSRVSELPAEVLANAAPVGGAVIDVQWVQTKDGSEPMSASLITHNVQVWVVGQNHPGHVWSIEGIYLSETEAESHCSGFTHFIAPIRIGVPMPQPRTLWPGLRYPKAPPPAATETSAPGCLPNAT